MLYLPPLWGHDGTASGACMTCSVGFRSPDSQVLATELLQRLADLPEDDGRLYRDPSQPATATPGAVPPALLDHAFKAVQRRLAEPQALERALGESLSEPKPAVWFTARDDASLDAGVRLDRRTRMLYDSRHVYVNGESFRMGGRDARLVRALADKRQLDGRACQSLSAAARHVVQTWLDDGWLQPLEAT